MPRPENTITNQLPIITFSCPDGWTVIPEVIPPGLFNPPDTELDTIEQELFQHPNIDADVDLIEADDITSLYLKEATQAPLLNPKEEINLAKRIMAGCSARKTLAHNPPPGLLDLNELEKIVQDGHVAYHQLVQCNTRLVISIANNYRGRGVPFLDLIQEGNIGLIRATKFFDYRLGYKFPTYAYWWIRQAVLGCITKQSRTVRIPYDLHELSQKIHHLSNTLSPEEIGQQLGLNPAQVDEAVRVYSDNFIDYLDAPMQNTPQTLSEHLNDPNPSPESLALNLVAREHLISILNNLPPRERLIITLRTGLRDGYPYTLEEVGQKLGVTREAIRQIQNKALEKLRVPHVVNELLDYLNN